MNKQSLTSRLEFGKLEFCSTDKICWTFQYIEQLVGSFPTYMLHVQGRPNN